MVGVSGGLHTTRKDIQGDHLSLKSGNVREFDSCQGNVRDFTKKSGKCEWKKSCQGKLPKSVYCKLHICVHSPYRYLV